MSAHDPFTGRELRPEDARSHSEPVQPTAPRLGVPPDKFGAAALTLQQDSRQAVMMMLFPPEALRDASYPEVEQAVFANGAALLQTIAQEIHKSYTSEPLEPGPVITMMDALKRHVDASRRGGGR